MDRFTSMQVYTSVVELGSFTAAANVFRMSPGMVTKHINAIEKRLDATLIKRTTRRLQVTEVGKAYYESCKEILKKVEDAEAGTAILSGKPKGLLKVTASLWFGSITLTPIVCDYLNQFPDVSVELSLSDRFVDIIDEHFDVAIRIGELSDSSLIARKLATVELSICASPAYLNKHGTPTKPEDLKNHECLGFTNWRSQSGWKVVEKALTNQGMSRSRFDSNNGQALRQAALKGIGIILMPKVLLAPDIQAGRLVEVLKEFTPPPRPVNAVYPKERQTTPKLASFVDYLAEHLK
ncbi:LysR family transcriptional regulator [Methylophilus sp. QUAN]|uniref:LysR family transcriptional regulator n=1 Tax=Methylophilus sp. QUAN TaxID=2781020 RepID=UPI00188FAD65|nr:LysR family transcriptional regulator [Methylophilus sp. QUAN]MBF4990253.1 LysR family transcriptional regulator [Methylophilus sp. QUAN]